MTYDPELEARAKERLGQVLRGKYRLDHVLGIGGMATVYRATHRNQAEFAVKILHPELSMSLAVRTRFVREGYAANSVRHPGVVRVVDDDVSEDGQAFLVMDLLDGHGLDHLHERAGGRVQPALACALVVQLLDILSAAHAKNIVHRDIKPANLFVTHDGTLKVLDFGIARARDEAISASATGTGVLLGTPAFMSPEQASGRTEAVDGRSDVWSAGATLFTLLSGEYVHGAQPALQLVISAATREPRSLASVAPELDARLVSVVARSLALVREDRWASAREMRDALVAATTAAFGAVPTGSMLAAWVGEEGPTQAASLDDISSVSASNSAPSSTPAPAAPHPIESTLPGPMPAGGASIDVRVSALPASVQHLGGSTTARPVASTPTPGLLATADAPPRRAIRTKRWALSLVALSAALGAWGLWSHRPPTRGELDRAGEVATQPVTPAPPEAVAPPPQAPPTSGEVEPAAAPPAYDRRPASRPTAPVAEGAPPPAATHTPLPSSTPTLAPSRTTPRPSPGPATAKSLPTPVPASPVAPSCNPNFTLDADGAKHFKPECF